MKARISAVFNRRNKTNKDGLAEVSIYVYLHGKKKYYPTQIFIDPEQWNHKKNKVSDQHSNWKQVDYRITQIINEADAFQLKILQQRDVTFEDFDFHFQVTKKSPDSFIQFCEDFTSQDRRVTTGTTRVRKQTINILKACFPSDWFFQSLTYENIQKLDNFMKGMGLQDSTIAKHHNRVKMFILHAINRDIIEKSPYRNFKIKIPPPSQKNILWYDDLERIEALSYPPDHSLELARLKFLFCCYTGLRVSDSRAVTHRHIRNGKLMLTAQKTLRPVVVPLDLFENKAAAILDIARQRYTTPTIFPPIADQYYNDLLKVITVDAQVPFPITSHVARHTFCTLVAHKTQSPFKVMEYTGITKVDTAMIYINLQKLFT